MNKHCDYKVGRGRPPKEKQFKKGRSGNPSGRPKRGSTLTQEIQILLSKKITIREGGRAIKVSRLQALARGIFRDAMSGDWRARQLLITLLPSIAPATTEPVSPFTWTEEDDKIDKWIEDHEVEIYGQRRADRESRPWQSTEGKEAGDSAKRDGELGPEY